MAALRCCRNMVISGSALKGTRTGGRDTRGETARLHWRAPITSRDCDLFALLTRARCQLACAGRLWAQTVPLFGQISLNVCQARPHAFTWPQKGLPRVYSMFCVLRHSYKMCQSAIYKVTDRPKKASITPITSELGQG